MTKCKVVVFFGIIVSWACGGPVEDIPIGNNAFTASLYREIMQSTDGNFLVSPFSANIILALTQAGAKDKTAEEIRTSLNLPENDSEVQRMFKSLMLLVTKDANFTLNTANKIYIKDDLTLKDSFKKTATEVYKAEVENIDFEQSEEAAEIINEWVEERTENKIQNLIDSGSLDESTATVLVNALYFKGQWRQGFNNKSTTKQPFHTNAREMIQVDMMYDSVRSRYFYEDSVAEYLEMPFWGNSISMIIALPKEIEGLRTLENKLETVFTPHAYQKKELEVGLPKFKIESSIDLKQPLSNLGVRSLFDPYAADLSGMINEVDNLYVDKIQQKSYMAVDENGVEAAAATYNEVGITSLSPQFLINRPFLFYIKYGELVIFTGRIVTPEQ